MPHVDYRLSSLAYDPQNFRDVAETELGKALWDWLRQRDNAVRMETATYLERPAVEPLSPYLVREFGAEMGDDRTKQTIGHMVRQVMEALGYELDRLGVRITGEGLFTTGARYRTPRQPRDRAMRITREQRDAWLVNTAQSPFNVWLNAKVRDAKGTLDLDRLYAVADEFGLTGKRETYSKLNPGQQRMNIGIQLRRVVDPSIYEPNP